MRGTLFRRRTTTRSHPFTDIPNRIDENGNYSDQRSSNTSYQPPAKRKKAWRSLISLPRGRCLQFLCYTSLAFIILGVSLFVSLFYPSEKYLLYYNHSGFSNQIMGIQRAAYLAIATNRTLVLPPLLPHKEKNVREAIQGYKPRSAGIGCKPYERYQKFVKTVEYDARIARRMAVSKLKNFFRATDSDVFPSFLEILDFSEFMKHTGLKVMDMQHFAMNPFNMNFRKYSWCSSEHNAKNREGYEKWEDVFAPGCEGKKQGTFSQLGPFLEKACGWSRVAVIGSALSMPRPNMTSASPFTRSEEMDAVQRYLFGATPSSKMLKLLAEIHSHLPEGYAAVHIRFGDLLLIDDCDDEIVKGAYDIVLSGLEEKKVKHGTHVLIGNGNKEAKRCFEHHARGRYTVSTINDVISAHADIQHLVDGFNLDISHVFMFVDLVLLSVADNVVFAHAGVNANTFQLQIKRRHKIRKMLKEKMASAINK